MSSAHRFGTSSVERAEAKVASGGLRLLPPLVGLERLEPSVKQELDKLLQVVEETTLLPVLEAPTATAAEAKRDEVLPKFLGLWKTLHAVLLQQPVAPLIAEDLGTVRLPRWWSTLEARERYGDLAASFFDSAEYSRIKLARLVVKKGPEYFKAHGVDLDEVSRNIFLADFGLMLGAACRKLDLNPKREVLVWAAQLAHETTLEAWGLLGAHRFRDPEGFDADREQEHGPGAPA